MTVEEYDAGNGKNTVDFIKQLQVKYHGSRLLILWDGASYHKYAEMREYLKELNDGLEEKDWPVTCTCAEPVEACCSPPMHQTRILLNIYGCKENLSCVRIL